MKRILAAVLLVILAAPSWAQKERTPPSANSEATLSLLREAALAYYQGDYASAAKEFRKGANLGHAGAQNTLGIMYSKGHGVPQDYGKAQKWYTKAADQGNANAQLNLGIMYAKGLGVPQDYGKAKKWYTKAADQGQARAQFSLGIMYDRGLGVPQDHGEAVKWYRKAADQNFAQAQSNLGSMYGKGLGVPQDYVQAHMWFNLAVALGEKRAAKGRDIVEKRMTPADISKAQRLAREWFDKHKKK